MANPSLPGERGFGVAAFLQGAVAQAAVIEMGCWKIISARTCCGWITATAGVAVLVLHTGKPARDDHRAFAETMQHALHMVGVSNAAALVHIQRSHGAVAVDSSDCRHAPTPRPIPASTSSATSLQQGCYSTGVSSGYSQGSAESNDEVFTGLWAMTRLLWTEKRAARRNRAATQTCTFLPTAAQVRKESVATNPADNGTVATVKQSDAANQHAPADTDTVDNVKHRVVPGQHLPVDSTRDAKLEQSVVTCKEQDAVSNHDAYGNEAARRNPELDWLQALCKSVTSLRADVASTCGLQLRAKAYS